MKLKILWLTFALFIVTGSVLAQTPRDEIRQHEDFAAGIFAAYPEPGMMVPTPPPGNKKPFYINHYSCHGSCYLEKPEDYSHPYNTLLAADSIGKLTPLGRDVLHRLELLMKDADERWGELTKTGGQQMRAYIDRLVKHYPAMFTKDVDAAARSTTVNRSILSMQQALLELSKLHPMPIRTKASVRSQFYMNPQDKKLAAMRMNALTRQQYDAFVSQCADYSRLMGSLFSDTAYVRKHVDTDALGNQLFRLAGSIQGTDMAGIVTLYDLFTPDERYRLWKKENAWNYINYGGYTLNGGKQPYFQRSSLRQAIVIADSIIKLRRPVIHIRYTQENVILSLACLLDINGYGLQTDDLETLDEKGWADYRIAPMGGNIQIMYYREHAYDDDVLVKVLLNEHEARLPLESDIAPYYHWKDFREYYLRKLDAYED